MTHSEEINVILVTHSKRIRCFLESFFKNYNNGKEIRFQNSSILLLTIMQNKPYTTFKASLSLVFDGEMTNTLPRAYFGNNDIQTNSSIKIIKFTKIDKDIIEIDDITKLLGSQIFTNELKKNYNIYIIRHSEATHNIGFFERSYIQRDTLLTPVGKIQSEKIADYFTNLYNNNNIKIDYLFTSRLKRTRQTLEILISRLKYLPDKIIVLPCSHEIDYNKDGNCDNRSSFKFFQRANIHTCINSNDNSISTDNYCDIININNKPYKIDWDLYKLFKKEQYHCKNTNMIQILIYYIEQEFKNKNNNFNNNQLIHIYKDPSNITNLLNWIKQKILRNQSGGDPYYNKYLKYKYKYLEAKYRLL